jgi:hypothetical protein
MTTTSSKSETFASHIQGADLTELQKILRELKQMRSIRKQAGKKSLSQTGIRVELPVGTDRKSADGLLKKLSLEGKSEIVYIENPKLIAGIRIFIGDMLYDGSFTTLTQKI